MEPIVPLISTSVAGPLGIVHLPRLWLKISLHAIGSLPEGYRHGNGGFDEFLLTSLGIEPASFIAYIENELPSYLACEAWVRTHATKLDPETIARTNRHILGGKLQKPEMIAGFHARFGVTDPSYTFVIPLNDLDDWDAVHQLVRSRAAGGQRTGRANP